MRLITLLLLLGCVRGPGETCNSSERCLGGGLCLKGVCSGYACATDEDCGELRCGAVAGSRVCVEDCSADEDCSGQQTCTALEGEDSGAEESVCL